MLRKAFEDKRLTSFLFVIWGFLVLGAFESFGVLQSKFVGFGPSPNVKLLDVTIDTWTKWWLVVVFQILDTFMWEMAHDSIVPWTFNVLADPKCPTIPYSKWVCLMIVEGYMLHGVLMGAFGFFISLTQLDLVLIRGMAKMIARGWTHWRFMDGKVVEIQEYKELGKHSTPS